MSARILIAGIGNIFMGDDAFGCEVVKELETRKLPEPVGVVDFGIRSYDLAFEIAGDYGAVVLVDAVPMQAEPGATCLLELDINQLPELEAGTPDPHTLNPVSVLQLARGFGDIKAKLFLVGCRPAVLEREQLGLSHPVRAAIPQAVAMIEELVNELLGSTLDNTRSRLPNRSSGGELAGSGEDFKNA